MSTCLPGLGKSHPQNKNKFEKIVEWKPIGSTDSALDNSETGIDNPVRQPLSIICLCGCKQSLERVVSRNKKACEVDQESSTNVEENQEKVDADQAEKGIDLWN
ncbi:hypothetical protein ACKS0A_05223 [Histoplasma ohiense]